MAAAPPGRRAAAAADPKTQAAKDAENARIAEETKAARLDLPTTAVIMAAAIPGFLSLSGKLAGTLPKEKLYSMDYGEMAFAFGAQTAHVLAKITELKGAAGTVAPAVPPAADGTDQAAALAALNQQIATLKATATTAAEQKDELEKQVANLKAAATAAGGAKGDAAELVTLRRENAELAKKATVADEVEAVKEELRKIRTERATELKEFPNKMTGADYKKYTKSARKLKKAEAELVKLRAVVDEKAAGAEAPPAPEYDAPAPLQTTALVHGMIVAMQHDTIWKSTLRKYMAGWIDHDGANACRLHAYLTTLGDDSRSKGDGLALDRFNAAISMFGAFLLSIDDTRFANVPRTEVVPSAHAEILDILRDQMQNAIDNARLPNAWEPLVSTVASTISDVDEYHRICAHPAYGAVVKISTARIGDRVCTTSDRSLLLKAPLDQIELMALVEHVSGNVVKFEANLADRAKLNAAPDVEGKKVAMATDLSVRNAVYVVYVHATAQKPKKAATAIIRKLLPNSIFVDSETVYSIENTATACPVIYVDQDSKGADPRGTRNAEAPGVYIVNVPLGVLVDADGSVVATGGDRVLDYLKRDKMRAIGRAFQAISNAARTTFNADGTAA